MKKFLALAMVLALGLSMFTFSAGAEENSIQDFDWDSYTLDELIVIQEGLTAKIGELRRQWAIEHGDRAITIDAPEKPIYVGQAMVLTASVEKLLDTAPDATAFVWSSSDPSVASVNAYGTVTGLARGNATITCSAADNDVIFAEKEVEVILPVTAVEMNSTATALIVEGSKENGIQLSAKVKPADAYCQELQWTSSNEAVARVDKDGYVTALTPGYAYITATSMDELSNGAKKATCTLTVLQAASSVNLDTTDLVLNMGAYYALNASVLPVNASNKAVTWESSAPDIVTVVNGQLRAAGCGDAVITATAADGSGVKAECKVSVIQMVSSVAVAEAANPLVLNKDEEKQLTAVITPDYATDPSVSWSSSDESIVTVSDDGVLYGVNGGTAVITCTAKDGSGKAATVNVFVPSISVEQTEYTVDSKEGLDIPVHFYGQEGNFDVLVYNPGYYFNASKEGVDENGAIIIHIDPLRSGQGALTLTDKADGSNNRSIIVNIGHDAVYDSTSYPTGNYTAIMRDPRSYDGQNMSIYGRVLQKQEGSSGYGPGSYTTMRVATSGYYDNVFYVTCPYYAAEGIIEDDFITVYGECDGTKTYTTIMGASVTIPELFGEKVILGHGQ